MLRRGSGRLVAAGALLLTVVVCVYFTGLGSSGGLDQPPPDAGGVAAPYRSTSVVSDEAAPAVSEGSVATPAAEQRCLAEPDFTVARDVCPYIHTAAADVKTIEQFNKFDFQPYWMKSREYWDNKFEDRYKRKKQEWPKLPLKVIVVPHSHNDPGWLKTYESYYHYQTRNILNNMADKLTTLKNMTFIWSEISFFSHWWESAHPNKRRTVKKLLEEGRLEITTGGWVMTDEATVHIYAMLDQLIEGHQWVRNNLGVEPKSGWSIDPFGHGSTVPYLLKASGVNGGTVIQRVHYAWKQWLAEQQMGDFIWRQTWDNQGLTDILTHNQPFDIYSIKHSCGPHPQVCLNFDFRKIAGEYTEYSLRAVPIDDENVKQKAELLLEQYGRTGSLFEHNVVMMPLGDDFRYDHDIEWDQQYRNYKRLFDYINKHKDVYNAEVQFGTPHDYFQAVKDRMKQFKVLSGDFFVYSDIFSEGRPAYWSGYFTTRPYWKILDRELEANLRSAEILYTFALNRARRLAYNSTVKVLERDYEKLSRARQNLALFQHHDAITGTSKAYVMHDYALKIFESIQEMLFVQGFAAQSLLTKPEVGSEPIVYPSSRFIVPDIDRESYEKPPRKVPLTVKKNEPRKVILFNSLAQYRQDIIKVKVTSPKVRVLDSEGKPVVFQVSPVWEKMEPTSSRDNNNNRMRSQGEPSQTTPSLKISNNKFELMFVADLAPLSLNIYTIEHNQGKNFESRAVVYCKDCKKHTEFNVKNTQPGDIQLENHDLKLLIDGRSGFLRAVTHKATGKTTQCSIQFAAYPSAQFHSGAYLFMPDPNSRETEKEILDEYPNQRIFITSGPVSSELTVIYGNLLMHSIRIYHTQGPYNQGIQIENVIDFEAPPKNRETELFMRVVSDISNGDPPEFYSDLNGFQMQRRMKVERIGIEGNYFPITTAAYIQDATRRLTLLVNHAQGASSWQPGWLEVMLDRRTLYDDSRGMGEGVVDNKRTTSKFWLLLEDAWETSEYSKPSLLSNHLSASLLYPPGLFVVEEPPGDDEMTPHRRRPTLRNNVHLVSRPLPCDVHLLTLRTVSDQTFTQFPSNSALMVLHRQGFACNVPSSLPKCSISSGNRTAFHTRTFFFDLKFESIVQTTLTGLRQISRQLSFDDVHLSPMNLLTLNVTFSP
ncbi:alpha-mannosidase 2 [Nilaparvata lugens]|uniref:alpha-mannosidase 2 n=1 Tax=Nilaparvata lugens TaxID=108931 RepID=UPI00193D2446|nr:alpha-mannosidase 2 [Nilaparvata lugens]